jgi:hypothetical protein
MSQVNETYVEGRQQYKSGRPQAVIWADQKPTFQNNKLLPIGYEIGIDTSGLTQLDLNNNRFLILSDHNRGELGMNIERIEQKRRMVNGTMRSYHVADKTSISIEWEMLPSRSFKSYPTFDELGKPSLNATELADRDNNPLTPNTTTPITPYGSLYEGDQKYTVDGGAGGVELLDWYEKHKGPFWVMLSYDKYNSFTDPVSSRSRLKQYTQYMQMYISSFNYSVIKRGANNFDMWNVSVQLEEV